MLGEIIFDRPTAVRWGTPGISYIGRTDFRNKTCPFRAMEIRIKRLTFGR